MSEELTKPGTVVPICSAMGFAYVLRVTDCDHHLVHLLLRPLDRPLARFLLIPGSVAAGYVVNMAIVSQSGAVAVVGSILLPLLLSKGFTRVTAGSLLLLGCSMGGELFNPGAIETVTLSNLTKIPCVVLAQRSIPLNLIACVTALLVYWYRTEKWERAHAPITLSGGRSTVRNTTAGGSSMTSAPPFPINPAKAAVPFVPLLLLFGATHTPLLKPFHDHVTILVAMLLGVVAAGFTSPLETGKLAHAFFEGMGFAYARIISITVSATLFAEGIKINGLIQRLVGGLAARPGPALLAAIGLPGALAALSGSGAGAASSMMRALIPDAVAMHLDPVQTGSLISMASHLGRTMSPVAAVTILCATLALKTPSPREENADSKDTNKPAAQIEASEKEIAAMTLSLVQRVALPLLAGAAAMYLAALLGVGR